MSSDVAIRVGNLSKCYQVYDNPRDRLKQFVMPRVQTMFGREPHNFCREFWALRDISFEVRKGETVGIIGRNGSGKSTLLQIICGTLTPTGGTVATAGRVAALLELGAGFNPEFTGRENVFMNGAILGLGRSEMEARFDEIAAFADIGDYIDQPVKTYSSGMVVRLAFAVASCIEPDVLIVDEALAVGDISFQARCLDKIKRLTDAGTTTLFVTHDIGTFQNLCHYGYLLDHGSIFTHGRPAQVAMQYYELMRITEHARQRSSASEPVQHEQIKEELQALSDEIRGKGGDGEYRFGTGRAVIVDYRVCDALGHETAALEVGRPFTVTTRLKINERVENLSIGIMFRNAQGQNLMGMHSYHEHRVDFGVREPGDELELDCTQEMLLNPGDYLLSIGVADCRSDYDFVSLDSRNNLAKVSVVGKSVAYGLVHTTPRFELRPVGGREAKGTHVRWGFAEKLSLGSVIESYEGILASDLLKGPVEKILSCSETTAPLPPSAIEQEERSWPGELRFTSTGYSRMMLGRYAFAGAHFCKDAEVLDVCSGLGWGSYLVSHFARHVTAFDQDRSVVGQCGRLWPRENISWLTGDALDPAFLGGASFDTVLGMEAIEHFTRADGEVFLRAAAAVTRPGGIFIGTSSFPETRQEADAIQQTNPFHLHIFTRTEILELLQRYFGRAVVVGGWMFIAVKESSRG